MHLLLQDFFNFDLPSFKVWNWIEILYSIANTKIIIIFRHIR